MPPPLVSRLTRLSVLVLLVLSFTRGCGCVTVSAAMSLEVSMWFSDVAAMYELSDSSSATLNLTTEFSSDSVASLLAGNVDFALVMGALSTAQAAAQPNVTLLPIMCTALVPVYRLDSINASIPLVFSGATLALIYAGNITNWNDSVIQADNPGRALPNQNITVCYQSDSFTGSYIFTTALNHFDPSIASILPPSYLPAWPLTRYAASLPGTGTQGVVSNVVSTDGSIGIASQPAAQSNYASTANMINRAGNTVTASSDSTTYTIAELLTAPTLTTVSDLTDPTGEHAWPMLIAAYLLLASDASPRGCTVRQAVVEFWEWYYSMASEYEPIYNCVGIVSMPDYIKRSLHIPAVLTTSLTCNSQPLSIAYAASMSEPIPIYGTTRLAHLITTLTQFRTTSSDESITTTLSVFTFIPQLSTTAMQLGQQTDALTFFYPDEVTNVTATPINRTDYYLLPMFLTSIVPTYNPQLSTTVNIGSMALVIDWPTIALILLQNITDWHDPRMIALNPSLATLLDNNTAPITLAFGCRGNNPLLTIYVRAVLLGLSTTNTALYTALYIFLTDPTTATKFNNCQQVFNTVPIVYSTREDTIAALVQNTPGAMGYGFGSSMTGKRGVFDIVYPYTDSSGQQRQSVRSPTAEGLLACAEAMDINLQTMELDTSDTSALNQPDCWPMTQVVYAQIPKAYEEDMRESGLAVLQLLQWINNNSALDMWTNNNLLVRTAQLPVLQSSILGALQSVTCDGDTLLITLPVIWHVDQSLVYTVTAAAALGCFATTIALYIVLLNRVHGVFRSASPTFMAVSLIGVELAFVCAVLLVASPSPTLCNAVNWTGQLAFTLVFSPLLAKTYRIYRIFGRQRLKVVRITNRRLLIFVAALVALDVCMLAVWQGVSPMDASTLVRYSSNGERVGETIYTQCLYTGHAKYFFVGEAIVKALLLSAGVLLAFSTRQASDAFNESKSIGFAIYNIVIAIGLIGPIIIIIDAVGNTFVLLITFCLLWISFFTLCILFIPKLLAFYSSNRVQSASRDLSQSLYTFLSLSQLTTAAMVQSYLTAVEQHAGDVKRRLTSIKRLEQGFSARGGDGMTSRTTASRPDTARSTMNTGRGSTRSLMTSNGSNANGDVRGSITLTGLAGWRKGTVAPSKSSTPTPHAARHASVTILPPLRLPGAAMEAEQAERPEPLADSPVLSSVQTVMLVSEARLNELLAPDSTRAGGLSEGLSVCEVSAVKTGSSMRQSVHMAGAMEIEELGSPVRSLQLPKLSVSAVTYPLPLVEVEAVAQRIVNEAGF